METAFTGVVDRIVDGTQAVVLLEAGGETIAEVTLDVDRLPDGTADGDVLTLTVEMDVVSARLDGAETDRRRSTAQERFDDLSEPLSDGDESSSTE